MTVYEAVVSRLAMLGYTVTDNDETGLNFLILRQLHPPRKAHQPVLYVRAAN